MKKMDHGKFHMGEYAQRGFNEVYDKKEVNGLGGENYWLTEVCVKVSSEAVQIFGGYGYIKDFPCNN